MQGAQAAAGSGMELWLKELPCGLEGNGLLQASPRQGQALTHRGGKRAEEQVGSSHCQTTILTSSIANKEMEQKQVTDGK